MRNDFRKWLPTSCTTLLLLAVLGSSAAAQSPGTYQSIVGWQNTLGPWAAADLTGDGYADFVTTYPGHQQIAVTVSDGSGRLSPPPLWLFTPPCAGSRCPVEEFADVNGDGRKDLVSFAHGERDQPGFADVWVNLSLPRPSSPETGGRLEVAQLWTANFCDASQTCTVADVNGDCDGQNDPTIGSCIYRPQVYRYSAEGATASWTVEN
jgi:FG-GAP-like repeat